MLHRFIKYVNVIPLATQDVYLTYELVGWHMRYTWYTDIHFCVCVKEERGT